MLLNVFILYFTALTTTQMLHCLPQVRLHQGDYIENNGRCYEFIKTPHRTWPDAEHDCNSRGGHLVSIGSMAEQSFLNSQLWVSLESNTQNTVKRTAHVIIKITLLSLGLPYNYFSKWTLFQALLCSSLQKSFYYTLSTE